jgi:hypothetical protein
MPSSSNAMEMGRAVADLKELNANLSKHAESVFVHEQRKAWENKARADAEAKVYQPPCLFAGDDLYAARFIADLANHVYTMAWSRRKDRLARMQRDAGDEKLREPQVEGGT